MDLFVKIRAWQKAYRLYPEGATRARIEKSWSLKDAIGAVLDPVVIERSATTRNALSERTVRQSPQSAVV
jgi:hypothetical protein